MNSSSTTRKDRPTLGAILVSAAAGLFFAAVCGFFFIHATSVFTVAEPEVEETEEAPDPNIAVINLDTSIPAVKYLDDLLANPPSGLSKPIVDDSGTPNNSLNWVCGYVPDPAPVVSRVAIHAGQRVNVALQAFGAGQGAVVVDNAAQQVANCRDRNGDGGINSYASPVDGAPGFTAYFTMAGKTQFVSFFSRGDVLVAVTAPSSNTARDVARSYDDVLMGTLPDVCPDISVSKADATRNPYYDPDAYTGWNKGREVSIDVETAPALLPGRMDFDGIVNGEAVPFGVFPDESSIAPNGEPGERLTLPEVDIPTRPLDPIPASMPSQVSLPGDPPVAPTAPATTRTIPERVEDTVGPGCGWDFTAQAAPFYDATEEKKRADAEADKTREELRAAYYEYLTAKNAYVDDYATYVRKVLNYRAYADEVAAVAEKWRYTNEVRAEYRIKLDAYWRDVEEREQFLADQESAQESYDAAVKECRDNPTIPDPNWTPPSPDPDPTDDPSGDPSDDPSGDPSDDPTTTDPTDVEPPQIPNPDCPAERPSILDQPVPPEPTPPAKPTDVELPSSWTDIP